jgi:hypothetical protein
MPKINLAAPETRKRYRRSLEADKKSIFDSLVGLLQAPSSDLDWYAKLGDLVKELRRNEHQTAHGNDWFNFLAEALGVSASLVHKAFRFRQQYPTDAKIVELKNIPTDWTRLTLAFPIKGRQRLDFLVEAAREKWNINQIREQVLQRTESQRRGAGGRNERKALPQLTPESAVRVMKRLSEEWLRFNNETWANIPGRGWKQFVQSWPSHDRAKLQTLLKETRNLIAEVVGTARARQQALEALLMKVELP